MTCEHCHRDGLETAACHYCGKKLCVACDMEGRCEPNDDGRPDPYDDAMDRADLDAEDSLRGREFV